VEQRYPAGRISQLWRYPIKSLAAEPLHAVRVGPLGLEGDRERALFVESPEHARSGRTYRGKENNLLHTVADAGRGVELAAERHVAVAARGGGPHFDDGVVSIVFDTWIEDLEALAGRPLDPLRFRPNVFVVAESGFTPREADLVGATLHCEAVTLDVVATIERCVTPAYDVETGASDPRVLRAVAQERENTLGIYCSVAAGGLLERDARLWITPRGSGAARDR
jgi:uncharacterized protein